MDFFHHVSGSDELLPKPQGYMEDAKCGVMQRTVVFSSVNKSLMGSGCLYEMKMMS